MNIDPQVRRTPLSSGVDLSTLADKTEGYSGADLAALVREATVLAIDELRVRRIGGEGGEESVVEYEDVFVTMDFFHTVGVCCIHFFIFYSMVNLLLCKYAGIKEGPPFGHQDPSRFL
jgi:hypothetical protein